MTLPFSVKAWFAHPMLGTLESTITGYELGVELSDGVFQLKKCCTRGLVSALADHTDAALVRRFDGSVTSDGIHSWNR